MRKKIIFYFAIIILSIFLVSCKKEESIVNTEKNNMNNSIENSTITFDFGVFGKDYGIGNSNLYMNDIDTNEEAITLINNHLDFLNSYNDSTNITTPIENSTIKDCGKGAFRIEFNPNTSVMVLSSYSTKGSENLSECGARRYAMDIFVKELIKNKQFDWIIESSCVTSNIKELNNEDITFYEYTASGYSPSEKVKIEIFCSLSKDNMFFYYMTKDVNF